MAPSFPPRNCSTGPGFPTTPGVFEPSSPGSLNGTLTKLNPSGSALVYSTYLGATGEDLPGGLAVDGGGNALGLQRFAELVPCACEL